jgi:CRP/FNR family cyclic AMP-dependent transcriptional regulator
LPVIPVLLGFDLKQVRMALIRVTMIVEEVLDCPAFKKGDQITIDYPHIVLEETNKVCLSALNQCHPYILPLSRGVAFATLDIGEDVGSLRCYCTMGSVIFNVIKRRSRVTITPEILKYLAELKLDLSKLQSMPIFEPLPEGSLEKIIPLLQLQQINTGTDIIQQGDLGEFLYVITKGEVSVLRQGGQIREEVIANLPEGECFGEMSLISGEPISATIRAKTPVTLLKISKKDFDRLVRENPSLSIYFTKLLTQRLQMTSTRMAETLDKGMLGSIETFSIPELVQTLALNGRTGVLVISSKKGEAKIAFERGYIYQVALGDYFGEQAFYQLLTWQKGQFQFQSADSLSIKRQVEKDTMHLLMEGLRHLDEDRSNRAKPKSSSR